MKLTISGRQMTPRQSLCDLTAKKLARFDRFFGEEGEAEVSFSCRHNQQYAEITIFHAGTVFRSEVGAETFQNAIDEAVEALERQIRKNKTRLERRLRQGAFTPRPDDVADVEEEGEFHIRTKTFPARPMSVEEAILQMNLTNHQFYMFLNAETEQINVVYKRTENGYGLIAPEFDG